MTRSGPSLEKKFYLSDFLWDCWCFASIIGIWPRFIEPNLLAATKLKIKIENLPKTLVGLKILQFSDIHLQPGMSDYFLNKLINSINQMNPDIIVFTGDFLCYSEFRDQKRLKKLFNALSAPYGYFAIYGNHDYAQPVSINLNGEYDLVQDHTSLINKGFSRIFSSTTLAQKITERVKAVKVHAGLVEFLKETPFQLLHNQCKQVSIKGSILNICGLGEYTLGKCLPEIAFKTYDKNYPGLILAHNPDSVPHLLNFPGDLILCGHTHGGQVNLPWLWKKFTLLENMEFKHGFFIKNKKQVYVNRGVGSVMQFRWFARPEITLFTLEETHAS